MLKFFRDYPYIVYSILTLAYVFIFIRWKGIKRLWPASILGASLIFIAFFWLISVGVYKTDITLIPIFGVPGFFIIWGAANGIVFANYIRDKFYQKVLLILGFAGITVLLESFVEYYKRVEHLGKFNDVYEYIFDVMILTVFVFTATNLFGKRLKADNIK